MSELTSALERIRAWLESSYPTVAAELPPGLPLSRIEEIFRPLSDKLPQEVYELYQYCGGWLGENGTWSPFLFAPWNFMILDLPEMARETAKRFDEYELRYIGKSLLPVFSCERIYLCLVDDWQEEHFSPIVYVSEIYQLELHYVSLTSMMQVSAAAWETGVAYIDEIGFVECDDQKFFAIYRQYNSELPQMVLARLKSELELAGSERYRLYKTWTSISASVHWLTKCWPELSVEDFSPELLEPLVREMNNKDESPYSSYAKRILEKLKYKF